MKLFLPSWVKNFFSQYKDGYLWFFLTFTFALVVPVVIQLWMTFAGKDTSQCSLIFILESELLIFSMVVTGSLVIDDFLFKEESPSDFSTKLVFSLLPILIIIFCISAYIIAYFKNNDINTIIFMATVEFFIFIFTASYAALVKQTSFSKKRG